MHRLSFCVGFDIIAPAGVGGKYKNNKQEYEEIMKKKKKKQVDKERGRRRKRMIKDEAGKKRWRRIQEEKAAVHLGESKVCPILQ